LKAYKEIRDVKKNKLKRIDKKYGFSKNKNNGTAYNFSSDVLNKKSQISSINQNKDFNNNINNIYNYKKINNHPTKSQTGKACLNNKLSKKH